MSDKGIVIIRNILAVILGVFLGGMVNGLLITYLSPIFPPPEGVNPQDIESIKSNIHLYSTKHFISPFLAHAIGSLVAGIIAALIAGSHKMVFATIAGGFFIIGGIMMITMLPNSPLWFILVDLILGYFPMGWIGGKLVVQFFSYTSNKH